MPRGRKSATAAATSAPASLKEDIETGNKLFDVSDKELALLKKLALMADLDAKGIAPAMTKHEAIFKFWYDVVNNTIKHSTTNVGAVIKYPAVYNEKGEEVMPAFNGQNDAGHQAKATTQLNLWIAQSGYKSAIGIADWLAAYDLEEREAEQGKKITARPKNRFNYA